MELTGLHLLLSYACNYECDHCFVWGSPWQAGTMTSADIDRILREGRELGTVQWIYFEGGEPFLYYAVLVRGVRAAADLGFKVGVVSNGYWATSPDDACEWLRPLQGVVEDLSISSDRYHGGETEAEQARTARRAADEAGMGGGIISVAQPEESAAGIVGQLPPGHCAVMYRGRAAEKLVDRVTRQSAHVFTECPHENLRDPARVHIDPFGHVHVCQGITIGNVFETPLKTICDRYDPDAHPIVGPILAGGPAELAARQGLAPRGGFADACHLCYRTRCELRGRFPQVLAPDQMYGVAGCS